MIFHEIIIMFAACGIGVGVAYFFEFPPITAGLFCGGLNAFFNLVFPWVGQ